MSELKGIEKTTSTDSVEKSGVQNTSDSGKGNWFVDNVIHPLANGAALEPWNDIAGIADDLTDSKILPKVDLLSTGKGGGAFDSAVSSISEGVGSLVPYLVAAKVAGGALKGTARFVDGVPQLEGFQMTKTATGFLSSDRTARIAGAALYGAAREPQDGQSRFGNAVGSAVAFGAFELGGKLSEGSPLAQRVGIRLGTGFAGGAGQVLASNEIGGGKTGSASEFLENGVAGAAMNAILPEAASGLGKASDAVSAKLGRPISAESFARQNGWSGNEKLQTALKQNPLTRVKATDGASQIDQQSNVISINKDAGADTLVHELDHRTSFKASGNDYKEVGKLLNKNSPDYNEDAAWQKFRGIRSGQEVSARVAQNESAEQYNLIGRAETAPEKIASQEATAGETYEQKWQREFKNFKDGNGVVRPRFDNEGEGEAPAVAKPQVEGWNDEGNYQKIYSPDNMLQTKYGPMLSHTAAADGSWGEMVGQDGTSYLITGEPHDTVFGKAYESWVHPDKSVGALIHESPDYESGSEVTKFAVPRQTQFGPVTKQVLSPDRSSIVFDKQVPEGAQPLTAEWHDQPLQLGAAFDQFGTFHSINNMPNDMTIYGSHDGTNTLELYSEDAPLQTSLSDSPASVVSRRPGQSYYLFDDSQVSVDHSGDNIEATTHFNDEDKSSVTQNLDSLVEAYPTPVLSNGRMILSRELNSDGTLETTQDGLGVQYLKPGKEISTPLGNITEVHTHPPTEVGAPPAVVHLTGDNSVIDMDNGGINTNLGVVNGIKRGDGVTTLYRNNAAPGDWQTLELNYLRNLKVGRDASGAMVSGHTGGLGDGFNLIEDYPQGKITPAGPVSMLQSNGDGYAYHFADNSSANTNSYIH